MNLSALTYLKYKSDIPTINNKHKRPRPTPMPIAIARKPKNKYKKFESKTLKKQRHGFKRPQEMYLLNFWLTYCMLHVLLSHNNDLPTYQGI